MGRTLKRISIDFKWPLGTIWKGYLNPYSPTKCEDCSGSGLNHETKLISDTWYTHLRTDGKKGWSGNITQHEVDALLEAGRLMDFTRVPINDEQRKIVADKIKNGGNSWLPSDNGCRPTAEEVNAWAKKGFGHDGINHYICVEARAEKLGVYGNCELCKGHGHYWCDDSFEDLYENWESIEPPEGVGFQLWETTSEGSPSSPVFKTIEELCDYAAINCTTFGSSKASSDSWRSMLDADFVTHKSGNVTFI